MNDYGPATEAKIREVMDTAERYGKTSIIALAGVPGTGKSYIAAIAAQRLASDPLLVREVQFHPAFSYEEFVEGLRIDKSGAVTEKPGVFLEWNQAALDDPEHRYILLIEEITRANLPSLLGELLTYIEHRDRAFHTTYSRRPVKVAPNLVILATYNPADRSALELDNAFLRRFRVVWCPPDTGQLREMLGNRSLRSAVVDRLAALFDACRSARPAEYEHHMPFGHGIFSEVENECPDLYRLWHERIRHLIHRPWVEDNPFADVIRRNYPWRDPNYSTPDDSPRAPLARPADEDAQRNDGE